MDSAQKTRRERMQKYNRRYSRFDHKENTCFYCGVPHPSEHDHQPPISMVSEFEDLVLEREEYVIVKCCSECNKIASTELHESLFQRKEFIEKKLAEKRRKKLSIQHWNIEEIEELGYNLRNLVADEIAIFENYEARIQYKTGVYRYSDFLDERGF